MKKTGEQPEWFQRIAAIGRKEIENVEVKENARERNVSRAGG